MKRAAPSAAREMQKRARVFARGTSAPGRIAPALLGLVAAGIALTVGAAALNQPVTKQNLQDVLNEYAGSKVPGLQYVVVNQEATLFEYAGGWADIQNRKPMTLDTTMMAYSMTKTITAAAVLQLVEQGRLGLEDDIDRYVPGTPYAGHRITVRQLLDHTSGIPNPVPLRWVHLADDQAQFDEAAALAQVLRDSPTLAFEPGQKYGYSNIGYWLLGKIIEVVTGQAYADYVRSNVLTPLGIPEQEMGFTIPDPAVHASGYLARYSMLNALKGLVMDSEIVDGYDGNWLRLKNHNLDGPALGGLVGTAHGFSLFLQDQLRTEPVLFSPATRQLMQTRQSAAGGPIAMTLGWHIGQTRGITYLYKTGSGGGFHNEMRVYPTQGLATVVMTNSTNLDVTAFLNRVDGAFLEIQ